MRGQIPVLSSRNVSRLLGLGSSSHNPAISPSGEVFSEPFMIKLFVSQSLVEVETRKEVLEQAGIPCTVKNQQGSSLAGEVPFAEVFPELWVIHDDDYPEAKNILEKWDKEPTIVRPAWTCPKCGENHTGEFTTCWKCGKKRN